MIQCYYARPSWPSQSSVTFFIIFPLVMGHNFFHLRNKNQITENNLQRWGCRLATTKIIPSLLTSVVHEARTNKHDCWDIQEVSIVDLKLLSIPRRVPRSGINKQRNSEKGREGARPRLEMMSHPFCSNYGTSLETF